MTERVDMIVARDADPGMRTSADAWAECLREGGLDVRSVDITEASADATAVIVAPHATMRPIVQDSARVVRVLRRAVCVSTSRLGSGALGADWPFQLAASGSLALSRDASRYLTAQGVPTAHLKPGGHVRLRSAESFARRIAVGTHARYSSFREDVLARSRDALDPYPCDLRISRSAADHPAGHLEPDAWLPWLASVDVLVSLPPEAGPGADWCEIGPAVMNGAVVLTTAESDFGPLEPGEDVAPVTVAGFPDALRRLLADDERRERMRASALARFSAHPLDVTPLAEALESVALKARRARPVPVPTTDGALNTETPESDMRAALAVAEAARVRRWQARTGGADPVTTTSGWRALAAPALSVVIPSYGQAAFVATAVESALAAVGIDIEVVVIDDRSTDGSAAIVQRLLQVHDDRALKLVEHADNAGLAAARNRGFLESRSQLVLLLDADDTLLPHGPAALHDALQADPSASFAYGFLARVGLGRADLLGTSPWDPELLRRGNYVPATSLVRRSAWQLVGGYNAEGLLELGWEDMDFWLRMADTGQHAAHVRRIVGTYRVHGISLSTVANSHAGALMTFLRQRHPRLMDADEA